MPPRASSLRLFFTDGILGPNAIIIDTPFGAFGGSIAYRKIPETPKNIAVYRFKNPLQPISAVSGIPELTDKLFIQRVGKLFNTTQIIFITVYII